MQRVARVLEAGHQGPGEVQVPQGLPHQQLPGGVPAPGGRIGNSCARNEGVHLRGVVEECERYSDLVQDGRLAYVGFHRQRGAGDGARGPGPVRQACGRRAGSLLRLTITARAAFCGESARGSRLAWRLLRRRARSACDRKWTRRT